MKNISYIFTFLSLVILFHLSSCDDGIEQEPDLGIAHLMFINASSATDSVYLTLDDVNIDSSTVEFTENTSYLDVTVGNKKADVKSFDETLLLSQQVFLKSTKYYSLFFAKLDSINNLYIALQDNLTVPKTEKAKIRFINLSYNLPAVNIVTTDSITLFSNANFKTSSLFTEVDAKNYTLNMSRSLNKEILYTTPEIALTPGGIYTFWTKGLLNGEGISSLGISVIKHN
jgi:membrane-bound inhibitor of C-type lysozyme